MDRTTYRQHRFRRPPGAAEILLVRHGESAPEVPGSPAPQVDGHSDPELAPDGLLQAERVADRLAGEHVDAIYVTTLRRTVQTAAPLAARLGLPLQVEADLREVHLGEWEGTFRQHMASGDPVARRFIAEGRWDAIPGAEPREVFEARVRDAVARLAAAHPDQRIVAVCHGGVIGQILARASGAANGLAFTGADNGSISHLVVLGDRWTIRRFNDTAHLPGGFDLPAGEAEVGAGLHQD